MKICTYCHNRIPKEALICPMCGSDVSGSDAIHQDDFYQSTLFEDNTENFVDLTADEDDETAEAASRAEKQAFSFNEALNKFIRYVRFLWKKMKDPAESRKSRRESHNLYGYFTFVLSALLSAGLVTRIAVALANQYDLLSQISLLPTVTFQVEPVVWFMKNFLLFLAFYYLYPFLAYLIKTFFLHRRHAFHNWMTQYAGMNAFALLLLGTAFVISLIAPILMAVPVLLLFLVHLSSYLVTFIASLYQTINETKRDTLYLCLGGISAHLLLMMTIAYVLFLKM